MFGSENELVRWLRRLTTARSRGVELGVGDDAALVRVGPNRELILTTDLSIEGVHFMVELHLPEAVGHRALARALSDVAAMGGVPRFALISLAVSRRTSRAWIERFYRGVMGLARRYRTAVIGGDTAVVPERITVDAVVVGEIPRGTALRRSGARPGDQIFVSGRLGLSAVGLAWLQSGGQRRSGACGEAARAHLAPQPQCALGRYLAERRLASAAIDLSDGLSTDLGRLVEASGVGARIWEELIPGPANQRQLEALGLNPLELALHGGEDYQLLFTVPARRDSQVPRRFRGLSLSRIGEITTSRHTLLVDANGQERALTPAGYDHFKK